MYKEKYQISFHNIKIKLIPAVIISFLVLYFATVVLMVTDGPGSISRTFSQSQRVPPYSVN